MTDKRVKFIWISGGPGMGPEYFTSFISNFHQDSNTTHVLFKQQQDNDSNYTIKSLTKQIVKLIDQDPKSYSKTILIGHSFGSVLAVLASKDRKDIVDNCILISPIYDNHFLDDFKTKYNDYKHDELKAISQDSDISPNDIYKQESLLYSNLYFTDKSIAQGRKILSEVTYNADIARQISQEFLSNFSIIDSIQTIKNKIAIIVGDDDQILSKEYMMNLINKTKTKHSVISHTRHFPFIDQPRQCQEIINLFINDGGTHE